MGIWKKLGQSGAGGIDYALIWAFFLNSLFTKSQLGERQTAPPQSSCPVFWKGERALCLINLGIMKNAKKKWNRKLPKAQYAWELSVFAKGTAYTTVRMSVSCCCQAVKL